MDQIDDSFESFSCKEEKVEEEPGDLLEKSWFFGNLLDRKIRMPRIFSDPCPTSNYSEEMLFGKSYEETYSSIDKLPQGENFKRHGLIMIRAPSLPEESTQAKGSNNLHRGKSILQKPRRNNLLRAPSLPSYLGREEIQDEESDFSMSRLIRQASLKQSDILPPRHIPTGVAQSSSTPRHSKRRKPDLESILKDSSAPEGIRRQQPISRFKLAKSSSDLETFQELQGLRDLSIKYEKSDQLDQNETNNIQGLQEKKQTGKYEDYKQVRKPSSSEARQTQISSSPQVPDWEPGKRSAEDMKAQIKFWARAVASNVRQEY